MAKRKIIKIDADKCTGCGLCIPNCPEGALQMIDNKARLISDLFCDGLGACIGHCPEGAIDIEERKAEPYNEKLVMANIIKQGKNVIKAHLAHLKDHGEEGYLKEAIDLLKEKGLEIPKLGEDKTDACSHGGFACPGSKVMEFGPDKETAGGKPHTKGVSQLRQWPVQIRLVPTHAPYFKDADLLIAADCVPFAYADFHNDLLKDKKLLVGCPKLDDIDSYKEKLTEVLKSNSIKSVTYAHMEVPCCSGLIEPLKEAIASSEKAIPFGEVVIGIKGERLR
ncbi:MAG: 4Fe-4S binding protein [Candidatus Omnitrophica bacterium]|nr:4Fe-4S binding protein [Candidatus Omnitrophota bacterium]